MKINNGQNCINIKGGMTFLLASIWYLDILCIGYDSPKLFVVTHSIPNLWRKSRNENGGGLLYIIWIK